MRVVMFHGMPLSNLVMFFIIVALVIYQWYNKITLVAPSLRSPAALRRKRHILTFATGIGTGLHASLAGAATPSQKALSRMKSVSVRQARILWGHHPSRC